MLIKIIYWIGLIACVCLIISCFVPWTYHADVAKNFTAFFSEKNMYGRPGKFLIFVASIVFVFMLLPKLWAKKANLFLGAFLVAYGIKTYTLYTSCYNAYCPDKLFGIYLMLISTIIILMATVLPNMKIKN